MNQRMYGLKTASLPAKPEDSAVFVLSARPSHHLLLFVSGRLTIAGTSSAEPSRLWEEPYIHEFESTASSTSNHPQDAWHNNTTDHGENTGHAISELRRISGLTWEQLGQLFGVSRRSVHFWASGKPLNATNEARLMQMLDVIREAFRGDARSTRATLFQIRDGITPFALLTSDRFDEARELMGKGVHPPERRMKLSSAETAARQPLPPDELVGALQNTVHRDKANSRGAESSQYGSDSVPFRSEDLCSRENQARYSSAWRSRR